MGCPSLESDSLTVPLLHTMTNQENILRTLRRWPGETSVPGGLECTVQGASFLGSNESVAFSQTGAHLRLPSLPVNPHYASCPSDIAH
jgi:hypothetical protein